MNYLNTSITNTEVLCHRCIFFLVKCMFERCARRGVSMLFAETVLMTSRL